VGGDVSTEIRGTSNDVVVTIPKASPASTWTARPSSSPRPRSLSRTTKSQDNDTSTTEPVARKTPVSGARSPTSRQLSPDWQGLHTVW